MNEDRPAFLIFVKQPVPGKVKTRLGKEIGLEQAARLYKAMAADCITSYSRHAADCTIYYDPPEEQNPIREWLGADYRYLPQPTGTLGERLEQGIRALLRTHPAVIALGTDSPTIQPDWVHEAIRAVRHHDVVIGPTRDGGYYLLGVSRDIPELFRGIPWSTPEVFRQTMQVCDSLGLRVHVLPQGTDIDEPEDLTQLQNHPNPEIQHILHEIRNQA